MVNSVKSFSLLLILILAVSNLTVIFATIPFGLAQSGTNVTGIITTDTTWTKPNSPYTLTGPVAVNSGVTLTIEPGVTVNLNDNYIEVNGTLAAIGSQTDPIQFNPSGDNSDGSIEFMSPSVSWNDQTNEGSIIQNAVLSETNIFIDGVSPKITDDSLGDIWIHGGSPIITNNKIVGQISSVQNSQISIDGAAFPTISNNIIGTGRDDSIYMEGDTGSATITNNQIAGGISVYGSSLIYNNSIGTSTFEL